MNSIPPNDIDQVLAWLRLFAPDIINRIKALETKADMLNKKIDVYIKDNDFLDGK